MQRHTCTVQKSIINVLFSSKWLILINVLFSENFFPVSLVVIKVEGEEGKGGDKNI